MASWTLDVSELQLLHEACRCLDEIDALSAVVAEHGVMTTGSTGQTVTSPAVKALASSRLTLSRLVAQMRLPDPDGRPVPTLKTLAASQAARARLAGRDGAA
jgi:hypothetical protein